MQSGFANWLQSLEGSLLAAAIRESTWLYPILEIIHILGIVLVAGAAAMFDLLALFYFKGRPIDRSAFHLLTWSKRGLLLVVPSGILLFMTNAATLGFDPTFYLKLLLLMFAGINAVIFHQRVYLKHHTDGRLEAKSARWSAVFSLLLWTGVIACGRLLAY